MLSGSRQCIGITSTASETPAVSLGPAFCKWEHSGSGILGTPLFLPMLHWIRPAGRHLHPCYYLLRATVFVPCLLLQEPRGPASLRLPGGRCLQFVASSEKPYHRSQRLSLGESDGKHTVVVFSFSSIEPENEQAHYLGLLGLIASIYPTLEGPRAHPSSKV